MGVCTALHLYAEDHIAARTFPERNEGSQSSQWYTREDN